MTGEMSSIITQPLSASTWRVCDRRWPEHDARFLRGFIEQKNDDLFVVMQLDDGFEWFTFDTLTEATKHFAKESLSFNSVHLFEA